VIRVVIGIADEQSEKTRHLKQRKKYRDRERADVGQVCPDEQRGKGVHEVLSTGEGGSEEAPPMISEYTRDESFSFRRIIREGFLVPKVV
jgi:hypothetical protein